MQIEEKPVGDALVLVPQGKLDSRGAVELESRLVKSISEEKQRLVVDLGEIEFISSAGIRVLLMVAKRLRALGGGLVLCSLRPQAKEVFEVAGLLTVFDLAAGPREAVERLRRPATESTARPPVPAPPAPPTAATATPPDPSSDRPAPSTSTVAPRDAGGDSSRPVLAAAVLELLRRGDPTPVVAAVARPPRPSRAAAPATAKAEPAAPSVAPPSPPTPRPAAPPPPAPPPPPTPSAPAPPRSAATSEDWRTILSDFGSSLLEIPRRLVEVLGRARGRR